MLLNYSCRTICFRSVVLSFGGSLIALLLCIPAFMFGIVAKFTDWSQTGYACHGAPDQESSKYVLPLILKYLTPPAVSYIGAEMEWDFWKRTKSSTLSRVFK